MEFQKKSRKKRARGKKYRKNAEYLHGYAPLPRGKSFLFIKHENQEKNPTIFTSWLVPDSWNICKRLKLLYHLIGSVHITTNRAESTFNSFESNFGCFRGKKKVHDWNKDIKLWVYFSNMKKCPSLMNKRRNLENLIKKIVKNKTTVIFR